MIHTYNLNVANCLPQYLEKVVSMFVNAGNVVFNNKKELKLLIERLEKQLEKDKPQKSKFYIEVRELNKCCGVICLRNERDVVLGNDSVRLMYDILNGAYDYDEETRSFFRVNFDNVRIKDVFQEGGRL